MRRSAGLLASITVCVAMAHGGDPEPDSRVVSIGGAVTEIIYELGAEELLAGVDSTSTRPADATKLPDVGYIRGLSAEGLLSLRPELVLASEKAGPPEALAAVEAAGVQVIRVPDEPTLPGVRRKIEAVARQLGRAERGEKLLEEFDAAVAQLAQLPSTEPARAAFLMSRGDGALLAAGEGTAADAMLRLAGAVNVAGDHQGYKPISAEALVALQPEVVVTGDRTAETLGGIDGLAEHPMIRLTPAGKAGRIVAMDDLYLLGFGPRTPQAALELAHGLRDGG